MFCNMFDIKLITYLNTYYILGNCLKKVVTDKLINKTMCSSISTIGTLKPKKKNKK